MRLPRLLCAAALTVTVGLYVGFAVEPNDDARATRLKSLKKRFADESAELADRAKADPAAAGGIATEQKELAFLTAEKVIDLANDSPKDTVAFEAVEFFITSLPAAATSPDAEKAFAILTEHHLANPKVKGLLAAAGRFPKFGEKFLLAAAEKSADKEVRALAYFQLGSALARTLGRVPDNQAEEVIAKAKDYFEKATKEAPDAKVGTVSIAKAVEDQIQGMKVLVVGSPVPDAEGVNMEGKKVKLSSFKGKVVLLDIWATWCPPCRAMIPHERELVKRLEKKPFVLLSVSVDDTKDDLIGFLKEEPMPWTHWYDGQEGPVAEKFPGRGIPRLYLIDAKGVLRKKWLGKPDNEELDKAVDEVVKDAEKKG